MAPKGLLMVEQRRGAPWSRKKKTGFGCLGVAVAFVGLLALVPVPEKTPEEKAAEAREVVAERRTAAAAVASAKAERVAGLKRWARGVSEATQGCDGAAKIYADVVAKLGDGYDVYAAYNVSSQVKEACRDTGDAIDAVPVPDDLPEPVQAKVDEAVLACRNAYAAKYLVGDRSMEVFDGDMRPSKIAEARQFSEAAAAGVVLCAAGVAAAQLAGGVPADELPH